MENIQDPNPYVFPSLSDAIRNTKVYERARDHWRKNIDNGNHTGPYHRISNEEIKLAVKELWEEFEKSG